MVILGGIELFADLLQEAHGAALPWPDGMAPRPFSPFGPKAKSDRPALCLI